MEKRLENTYCVIMCGGVGSRFWPFSRQDRPKQFIDFFGSRPSWTAPWNSWTPTTSCS